MDISIFFAKLWGIFYLVFGTLFIVTGQLGKTIEMTDDKAFVISTGYVTFFLSLTTLILHNVWEPSWRIVITLLAWTTFFKGIKKIGFPETINKQAQKFKKGQIYSAMFMLSVGIFLLIKGFGVI